TSCNSGSADRRDASSRARWSWPSGFFALWAEGGLLAKIRGFWRANNDLGVAEHANRQSVAVADCDGGAGLLPGPSAVTGFGAAVGGHPPPPLPAILLRHARGPVVRPAGPADIGGLAGIRRHHYSPDGHAGPSRCSPAGQ